jgi:acyl-CoA hydrolase
MNSRRRDPVLFEDPNLLAGAIIERVGNHVELALPLGLGKANHVANALFARAAADPSIWLRIFTALTFELPRAKNDLHRRFIKPLADRLFQGYPQLAYAVAQREGKLPPNIEVDEFFFLAGSRLGIASAQQGYISANYTHALRYVLDRGVNVVAQLVAKRVTNGETRYSLGCNPDITLDLLAERRRGKTDFVFVGQVNSELPFMPGDADIPATEFAYLLEGKQVDFPLFAPRENPST